MKARRIELTADGVARAIDAGSTSLTRIWRSLGGRGSVPGSTATTMRELVPDIDARLAANKAPKGAGPRGNEAAPAKGARDRGRAWPRDPRNPFREGSNYGLCYDILAAHHGGLPRARLVELLARASGKDERHSAYDAQVLLSACGNDPGLSRNDGPRHRSCRPGFWVKRANGHVTLMVD